MQRAPDGRRPRWLSSVSHMVELGGAVAAGPRGTGRGGSSWAGLLQRWSCGSAKPSKPSDPNMLRPGAALLGAPARTGASAQQSREAHAQVEGTAVRG